ncbi:MAG: DUF488 domain-containing protein [Thermodesulfobacteriota bacterium]
MIKTSKTVYDAGSPDDGSRILVMRLWPRGVRKDAVDEWLRELGTSLPLIKEWKGEKIQWAEFKARFLAEMESPEKRVLIASLAERSRNETITLLCGCKDESRCHRSILKELIEGAS